MKNVTIIVKGRVPSKKNSTRRVISRGRTFTIPSKQHEIWYKEKSFELMEKHIGKITNIGNIKITIYAPDKRIADLTNKAESLMDLLTNNGIIEDDNWFVCPDVHLIFGGIDRENPRARIDIYESCDK